jgi:biopolymer transport protein ExbB/TolQ
VKAEQREEQHFSLLQVKEQRRAPRMAHAHAETLSSIQQYAAEARELRDEQMDMDASGTEIRLDQTIHDLQRRIEEQRAALEAVGSDAPGIQARTDISSCV